MGQYMYFYVKVDNKFHFIEKVKDNGLHNFTRDLNAPFGDAYSYSTEELQSEITDYEERIKRAEEIIAGNNELINSIFNSNDDLEEKIEAVRNVKSNNKEWEEFITDKKADVEYLRNYIYLNKIFGDGAVWIGLESGKNFDPENPPRLKWEKEKALTDKIGF